MAQAIVVFGKASSPGTWGAVPVMEPGGQSEEVTTSGTAASTTMTAVAGDVCRITAADGNIWASFGAAPTAAVGTLHFILSGQTLEYGPMGKDFKVSLIDDS